MTASGVRALHLITSDDRRGAQVFATLLAESLGGPPAHRVVAIHDGDDNRPLDVAVLGRRRSDPLGFARLVTEARRAEIVVAHGSSALLHAAVATAAARRPFVYRNIGDPSSWGAIRGADLRIGAPLRRAAAVAALYPAARDHLLSAYRLEPARVTTIPNGVPPAPDVLPAGRRSARADLGLDPDLRWVGFVGALSSEKGVLEAIDAVAASPGLGLVVAGSGPEAGAARHRAAERAPGRIRLLGSVVHTNPVYAAVDAVLVPSRTEGLPAVAIEAGLRGLPVVATSVGGLPDVVVDGVTGVLVAGTSADELAQGLRRALADGERLGAAAAERCRARYSMAHVADRWAELLRTVLDAGDPDGSRSGRPGGPR